MEHPLFARLTAIGTISATTPMDVPIAVEIKAEAYLSKLPSKRSKVKKIPVKNDFGSAESKNIFMDIPQSVIIFAQKGIGVFIVFFVSKPWITLPILGVIYTLTIPVSIGL